MLRQKGRKAQGTYSWKKVIVKSAISTTWNILLFLIKLLNIFLWDSVVNLKVHLELLIKDVSGF